MLSYWGNYIRSEAAYKRDVAQDRACEATSLEFSKATPNTFNISDFCCPPLAQRPGPSDSGGYWGERFSRRYGIRPAAQAGLALAGGIDSQRAGGLA